MIQCNICLKKMLRVTNTHLKFHNISVEMYKTMFPTQELWDTSTKNHYSSKEFSDKISKTLKNNYQNGLETWNRGKRDLEPSWNKGLTKETDTRVAQYAKTLIGKTKGVKRTTIVSEELREQSRQRMLLANPVRIPGVIDKIRQTLLKTYREHPEILENRKASGHNQFSNHYTSIEAEIAKVLTDYKISFEHNKRIGRYFADFFIFGDVVVECDGEYWHKDPEKDLRKDFYMYEQGYSVFRFTESRILADPFACVQVVLLTMSNLGHRQAAGFQDIELPF